MKLECLCEECYNQTEDEMVYCLCTTKCEYNGDCEKIDCKFVPKTYYHLKVSRQVAVTCGGKNE